MCASCWNPSSQFRFSCIVNNIAAHGPLTRYAKLRVAHAPGMLRTLSPPPRVSNPDIHHDICVTHVSWCMPGSLTTDFLWSQWRGKRSHHSPRMRNSQFCVSGKRPMTWRRSSTFWTFIFHTLHTPFIFHYESNCSPYLPSQTPKNSCVENMVGQLLPSFHADDYWYHVILLLYLSTMILFSWYLNWYSMHTFRCLQMFSIFYFHFVAGGGGGVLAGHAQSLTPVQWPISWSVIAD